MSEHSTRLDDLLKDASVWEPPHGFAQRIATLAVASGDLSPASNRRRAVDMLTSPIVRLKGFAASFKLGLEGRLWVARQYWALIRPHQWRA
jgi:hypothetical protein